MAYKHPLCPECVYHRGDPDICDQCDDASEFEDAELDETEQRRKKTPKAKPVTKPIVMVMGASRLVLHGGAGEMIKGLASYKYDSTLKGSEE